ncbi:hypothetical protein AV656_00355 [Bhargavaea cecembensis]|uniref:DUF1444 domain-containing protein n=1 Tax=Bhargavaea cecembensis TaxID=394098 RepID=A0A161SNR7_9BACL|nr:DUF1444 domain-containing protein [Bhargavaea cecembensis]KZE39783.1 hypothetical protein AV656_00355 [Bhargavaea cecembensis]
MKASELVRELKQRLGEDRFSWDFDRQNNRLKMKHQTLGKGLELSLPPLLAKIQNNPDTALDEAVYTINETFTAMEREAEEGFSGEDRIYPVIRSTSFPVESKEGNRFITTDHTAETRIFYALDLGQTYRLIDESMLDSLGLTDQALKESARFRVRQLPTDVKRDEVAGNIYYFVNNNDGYDASRILNEPFLKEMEQKIEGVMTVSVPHQDVLIIGDIRNDTGYDVLAQLTMHYFTVGRVPVTSLSFIYDNGELEPIFILAKNRPERKEEKE